MQSPSFAGPAFIDRTGINQPHALITRMKAFDDRLGAIDGAAVDDQNFLHLFGLRDQSGKTGRDTFRLVQYRQDNANTLGACPIGNFNARFRFSQAKQCNAQC